MLVNLVNRPYVHRAASVVNPSEEADFGLVPAEEHAFLLGLAAASYARGGSHACPVQAVAHDRVSVEDGGDVEKARHAESVDGHPGVSASFSRRFCTVLMPPGGCEMPVPARWQEAGVRVAYLPDLARPMGQSDPHSPANEGRQMNALSSKQLVVKAWQAFHP